MKKLLALMLIFSLILSGCAQSTTPAAPPAPSLEEPPQASPEEEAVSKPALQDTEPSFEPEAPLAEEPAEEPDEETQPPPVEPEEAETEITQQDVEDAYVDEVEVEPITAREVAAIINDAAPAIPTVLSPVASGIKTDENDEAVIDYSNASDGYVMVKYTESTQSRLKVLIKGPYTTYKYDLPKNQWTVFPFSDGNGSYQVGVYRNVTGTKYANVLSTDIRVSLTDQFAPFLRPNQYVNYWADSSVVLTGSQVVAGATHNLEKVEKVYDYVVANLTYDSQKAATVQSGYLPVLEQVLQSKTGICFDYAALMTAMLRSQNVPCKLMVGYAGQTYHAWINVWTEESGWVDGAIFFDGSVWKRMDPTFASSGGQSAQIMDFISRDVNYSIKYQY